MTMTRAEFRSWATLHARYLTVLGAPLRVMPGVPGISKDVLAWEVSPDNYVNVSMQTILQLYGANERPNEMLAPRLSGARTKRIDGVPHVGLRPGWVAATSPLLVFMDGVLLGLEETKYRNCDVIWWKWAPLIARKVGTEEARFMCFDETKRWGSFVARTMESAPSVEVGLARVRDAYRDYR